MSLVVDKLPGFLSPEFSADNYNNEHEHDMSAKFSADTITMMPSFSLQLGMSEDQNKQLPLKRCEVLHFTCITSLTNLCN